MKQVKRLWAWMCDNLFEILLTLCSALFVFLVVMFVSRAILRANLSPPTPQEPVTKAIEVPSEPTSGISSIEEMTERFDADGNVIERTTRIVIYAQKVEAEG